MRIWHESLIPKLCRQHLLAMWREGLGCYSILINNKNGYRQHLAVKEFDGALNHLGLRLIKTRQEMLQRGYKPKNIDFNVTVTGLEIERQFNLYTPWQTLEQQIAVLKSKNCECKLESIGGEK